MNPQSQTHAAPALHRHSVQRNALALRSLMQAWEQETQIEEEESEVDLMVMLSGMVGPQHPGVEA